MQTRVVKVDADKLQPAEIKQAAELLDAGGLAAFPTETVYGIGCRVEAKSLERLDEVKQRKAKKSYTVHIGQKDDVKKYVPQLGLRAEKLIRKAWPGPLTIVFELSKQQIEQQRAKLDIGVFQALYKDDSIGLRCPDNRIASQLLQHCQSTIVAPSANITGHSPATDAEEVLAELDGRIDLLLDGGPCRYKKSSTVVKLGKLGCELLREGVHAKRDVQQMWQVNILFVCTGNICRSPMAQGLCRKYLAEKLACRVDGLGQMGYKISSAGVIAAAGFSISREAIAVCSKAGVDITGFTSQPLSARLVQESDYIFVMCDSHRRYIADNWPEGVSKCRLLAQSGGITDPIGQSEEVYEKVRKIIEDALKKRISEWIL